MNARISFAAALAAALVTGISGVSSPAEAQPLYTPEFATMDRSDDHSSVTADLAVTFFDDILGTDITAFGLNLHGNFFFKPGLGGYATVPLSHVSVDPGDDESSLGAIELGGLYVPQMRGSRSLILRAGIALPTADDDGAVGLSGLGRITDLIVGIPDLTTLRLSASLKGQSDQLFWRADAGLDVPFDSSDEDRDIDPLLRLNVGAGFDAGTAAFTVELASLGTTGDVGDGEDRFIHSLGLSVRFLSGTVHPMLGISLPVGSDLDFVDFTLLAGVTAEVGPQ